MDRRHSTMTDPSPEQPTIAPGERFDMLTALDYIDKTRPIWRWAFECDCGRTTFATARQVLTGRKRSCGCLRQGEVAATKPAWAIKQAAVVWPFPKWTHTAGVWKSTVGAKKPHA
jgi:hypothetical protein